MDPRLRKLIASVKKKRPRTVLEHILKHGQITTDELKQLYGYNHPPRAARDVREEGIPLITTKVVGPDGRSIAAYRIGDVAGIEASKVGGRRAFSKKLKNGLLSRDGENCKVCGTDFPGRALQIDHRIPYAIAGEPHTEDAKAFMLLCGACNRAKSWSCEHCQNLEDAKDETICITCFWACPESYEHIAMSPRRQLSLTWKDGEIHEYESLKTEASSAQTEISAYAKELIRRALSRDPIS